LTPTAIFALFIKQNCLQLENHWSDFDAILDVNVSYMVLRIEYKWAIYLDL